MSDGWFPPYNTGSGSSGGSGGSAGGSVSVSGVGPMVHLADGIVVGRPPIAAGIVRIDDPDAIQGSQRYRTLQVGSILLTEFYKFNCAVGNEVESGPVSEEGKDTFAFTEIAIWGATSVPGALRLGIYTETGGNGVELLSPTLDLSPLIAKDDGVDEGIKYFAIPPQVRRTAFIYARAFTPQAMQLNISIYGRVLSQFERY
ncbi:hypothetical protein FPV16_09745 [Methylobacterium sp. W2]|uniref:hypothetical protein n=1 Tax=Methylobacterium sp. W2 TaxID=2598107 RepID=UPI001D0C689D|nr:hypothetical protein [Methylobacterium sp. W2]MCC0806497.1 hypothetical protein [Methylobacterium sp. W2]